MKNVSSINNSLPKLEFCCPEKWNEMTPNGKGRFCGKCEKVVSDFSAMSNEEIIREINLSQTENSCGRFKAYQLQKPFGDKRDKLVGFYQRINAFPKKKNFIRTIQLGLVVILLFISGCFRRTSGMYAKPSRRDIRHARHYYDSIHPGIIKGKRRVRKQF
jgi:hypothetical protein